MFLLSPVHIPVFLRNRLSFHRNKNTTTQSLHFEENTSQMRALLFWKKKAHHEACIGRVTYRTPPIADASHYSNMKGIITSTLQEEHGAWG